MRRAAVPADGHWHNLPYPDVVEIDAPLHAEIMIDILPDGTGRVRCPDWDGELISVHYRCKGERE